MKQFLFAAVVLAFLLPCGGVPASAQSMDDLNLQVHGYATQGFVYTTNNNWDTTDSTDGSSAWTEAVLNLTVQPVSRLRIGVQGRFYLLGNYGNQFILDWAQADYKANEHIGFRVGDVKTPIGLLNETQDIDPAFLWILLPQSIYPVASRNSLIDHYGGIVYGTAALGESFGKLDYEAYGGDRVVASDDGYLQPLLDEGITVPNGLKGPVYGTSLHWHTPIQGLMVGATESSENPTGNIAMGAFNGALGGKAFFKPYYFASYEHKKLLLAGEYSRLAASRTLQFTGLPTSVSREDQRSFYGMASYKPAKKLTAGIYYSSAIDREAAFTSNRYQKDWALSSRYDFNPYFYIKVEQHFVDGTAIGVSSSDNSALKPSTRMTMFKLGVSF